jgi:hydrogenase/urease accessory protein HupE
VRRRRGLAAGVVSGLLAFLSPAAEAHLASTGLGPVADGIAHLVLSVEDLVPVVAVAMLAGLNGVPAARRSAVALAAAWLAGGIVGYAAGDSLVPQSATTASFLALGPLVAANPRLAPGAVAAIAAGIGLLHGGLNGAGIAAAHREPWALAGTAAAVLAVAAAAAVPVARLRPGWPVVAVRVGGSWIAAVGLLMLGWGIRGA